MKNLMTVSVELRAGNENCCRNTRGRKIKQTLEGPTL